MRRARSLGVPVFLFFAIPLIVPGQQETAGTSVLGLRECLVQALANNLSLTVEALNPDIQGAAVTAAREAFLPQFGASFSRQSMTSLGVWGVQGTSYPYRFADYGLSLSQKFVTGTMALLNVDNTSSTTGQKYTVINPAYYGNIQLTLAQPLLKGFGPKVNRAATVQAQRQWESATAALKGRGPPGPLRHRTGLLESVQRHGKPESPGILARAEPGSPQAGQGRRADRESVGARRAECGDVGSRLGGRVGLREAAGGPRANPCSGRSSIFRRSVRPRPRSRSLSDKPSTEQVRIAYDEALAAALVNRPEIVQAEKQLAVYTSQAGYQANQVLPQLDLTVRGWSQGQSGVKYIYENGDPINGALLGTVIGRRWDAFKQALKGTYTSWSASVELTFPVANAFSHALLTQARLQAQQGLADLESQKQAAAFEIADAMKQLHGAESRMQSSAASRALQEKRLAAVIQRYQLGLVDSQWLFEYQRQLAAARTSEVQAVDRLPDRHGAPRAGHGHDPRAQRARIQGLYVLRAGRGPGP